MSSVVYVKEILLLQLFFSRSKNGEGMLQVEIGRKDTPMLVRLVQCTDIINLMSVGYGTSSYLNFTSCLNDARILISLLLLLLNIDNSKLLSIFKLYLTVLIFIKHFTLLIFFKKIINETHENMTTNIANIIILINLC